VDINIQAAESVASLIKSRHPNVNALATKADVGKETDIKAAVDLAVKEFGRLDVMVQYPFPDPPFTHPILIK
jgi:NAD(P)-dependent dehydrogenase (short-subunit alcohol dehydrogenase family)